VERGHNLSLFKRPHHPHLHVVPTLPVPTSADTNGSQDVRKWFHEHRHIGLHGLHDSEPSGRCELRLRRTWRQEWLNFLTRSLPPLPRTVLVEVLFLKFSREDDNMYHGTFPLFWPCFISSWSSFLFSSVLTAWRLPVAWAIAMDDTDWDVVFERFRKKWWHVSSLCFILLFSYFWSFSDCLISFCCHCLISCCTESSSADTNWRRWHVWSFCG